MRTLDFLCVLVARSPSSIKKVSKCVADTVHFSGKVVCTFIPVIWNGRLFFDLKISVIYMYLKLLPLWSFWLKQKKWNKCTLNFFWWMFEGRGSKNAGACIQKCYCLITLKDKGGVEEGRKTKLFKKNLSSVVLVFYPYHHLPKATKWHGNIQYNVIHITSHMFTTLNNYYIVQFGCCELSTE